MLGYPPMQRARILPSPPAGRRGGLARPRTQDAASALRPSCPQDTAGAWCAPAHPSVRSYGFHAGAASLSHGAPLPKKAVRCRDPLSRIHLVRSAFSLGNVFHVKHLSHCRMT